MPINTIKAFIDTSLPSGNAIAMSILRSTLKSIIDDYYGIVGSEENFTTALKNKLDNIQALAQVNPSSHTIAFITGLQDALDDKATDQDLLNAIAALVNSAPGDLDTLGEIAAALGNDANFSVNVYNAINASNNLEPEVFVATHNQTSFIVSETNILDDGQWSVQVGSGLLNSTTGVIATVNGGITINFATGEITFNTPLQGGTQVVVKYNHV